MPRSRRHFERHRADRAGWLRAAVLGANDGLRLVFFERWRDQEALDAHFKVPASRAFGALASKLAARAPELAIYEASELKLR